MGAAKKVVQLKSEAKKVELVEVIKDPAPVVDLADFAKTLTWPERMSDEEVEAVLETPVQDSLSDSDQAAETDPQAGLAPETGPGKTGRDLSKIALFASMAVIILLLGFYFHLSQNIKTLTLQVQDLSLIRTAVSSLDTKMNTMESKVADLETLPAKTRAALLSSILHEITQKTSYMSSQLESDEQKEKLMKAKELIQQVQTELNVP